MNEPTITIAQPFDDKCCHVVKFSLNDHEESGVYCDKSRRWVVDGSVCLPFCDTLSELVAHLKQNLHVVQEERLSWMPKQEAQQQ